MTPKDPEIQKIPFTVDSALLRELGERLVGKPHIALAELVKNSFDADAATVDINFTHSQLEVRDNGQGMNFDEFESFWMRIGTPHKEKKRLSRRLKRPMTGSKGVGRLAVQFLADGIELRTVSDKNTAVELVATVDWSAASQAGELTSAVAHVQKMPRISVFPNEKKHGTIVKLTGLHEKWGTKSFEELAKELWTLQPPFSMDPKLTGAKQSEFQVNLMTPLPRANEAFLKQMSAYLDLWHAKIIGKLDRPEEDGSSDGGKRTVRLSIQFSGREAEILEYSIEDADKLNFTEFEIRVYHLMHRQKQGIRVGDLRDYLNEFGGVHIYDAGFHLPFYGPDTDWLNTERDHSHRRTKSALLPSEYHVPGGMSFLPTYTRFFGVVHVNTGVEASIASRGDSRARRDCLKISVTRDRLIDSPSFQELSDIVRWAIDYYTMQEARRSYNEADKLRATEPITQTFARAELVLDSYKDAIPAEAYRSIRKDLVEAGDATRREIESLNRKVGLLASMATAGMSALANEHELNRELGQLSVLAKEIGAVRIEPKNLVEGLSDISMKLGEWIERAKSGRALFSHLLDSDSREKRERYFVKPVVDGVLNQIQVFRRHAEIRTEEIDSTIRFPNSTHAEWSALFQNVLINALNAMTDSDKQLIEVSSRKRGRGRSILVQDTGSGVNLETADELFEPFVRRLEISRERKELGLGGTGMGLAIVKMLADGLGCTVAFIEPDPNFNTAFELFWSEEL